MTFVFLSTHTRAVEENALLATVLRGTAAATVPRETKVESIRKNYMGKAHMLMTETYAMFSIVEQLREFGGITSSVCDKTEPSWVVQC